MSTIQVNPDHFLANYESGFSIDSSILHSDIDGLPIGGNEISSKKLYLKPDTSEIREMAWLKNKSYLVMGNIYNTKENTLYPFSPRNILQSKINELKNIGYTVKGASELEFFLYNKKYNENYAKGLTKLKEFGSHAEDYLIQQGDRFEHIYEKFRTKLKDSGLSVESMKGEASLGQHEINIGFNDAMKMSDSVLVLKTVNVLLKYLVLKMHCGSS
jgi:glutamine synthetase